VERAQAAFPGFELGPVSDATAEICRRLDGIPLAIELAAARTRQFAAPEIARRLTDRFSLLVGGPWTAPHRHQTLRQAIDWSYETLSASERQVLDSLSVLAGTFTLETAEALCADVDDVLNCLAALVDKSLVTPDRAGPQTRFRLLETVRAYGQEWLSATGREARTRMAQMEWATSLAESAEIALEGPEQAVWLEILDAEQDNLRGALDWAVVHEVGDRGLRMAASLWRYWEVRGFLSEGVSRLEDFLSSGTAPAALRAKALMSAGILAQNQLDHDRARAFYEDALAIHRSLGDRLGVAAALNGLGNVAVGEGDLQAAEVLFQQNLSTSREIGDTRMIAASLMNLGVVLQLLFICGDTDRLEGALRAHGLYLESLGHYRKLGDRHGMALALENLGAVAPYRGDYPGAQAFLEESLTLRRELRDKSGIAASARFLGHIALRDREFGAARRLHEESLAIESELGNHLLMATDLASLADIAEDEGHQSEAYGLRTRALDLFRGVGDAAGVSSVTRALVRATSGSG
jgi:tetratricopeptide (TPR) repeat protein